MNQLRSLRYEKRYQVDVRFLSDLDGQLPTSYCVWLVEFVEGFLRLECTDEKQVYLAVVTIEWFALTPLSEENAQMLLYPDKPVGDLS